MIGSPYPLYIVELGGSELLVGITAGGFALTSLVMRPVAGWFLDNSSRSSLLTWGTLLLIVISLLLMLVPILAVVIALRMASGFMFSGAGTASTTNACDSIPQKRFGEGIGYLGLGNTLATALGPALGLALFKHMGFRPLFAVSIAVLLLAVLIIRGFSYKKVKRADKPQGRKKNIWTTLFNSDALPASVVMLLSSVPYGGVAAFIVLYGEHFNLGSGTWFFVLMAVGTGCARLISGRIADVRGERPLIVAGNVGFLLALALLLVESSVCYYTSGLIFGLGFGAAIPAMQAMSMRIVPMEKRGSASSTYSCSYDIASAVGGFIAGWLVTVWGYRPMFASLCVFVVISMLVYEFWASKTPSAFKVYKSDAR